MEMLVCDREAAFFQCCFAASSFPAASLSKNPNTTVVGSDYSVTSWKIAVCIRAFLLESDLGAWGGCPEITEPEQTSCKPKGKGPANAK